MILLWKKFIRRCRDAIPGTGAVERCREVIHLDEIRVFLKIAAALAVILLLIDLFVEQPDWSGIVTEMHGMWLEIVLIAVFATLWIELRESRQWAALVPLMSIRILTACSMALDAVLGDKAARLARDVIYERDGIPALVNYDFDEDAGYGNAATGLERRNEEELHKMLERVDHAIRIIDSVLDQSLRLGKRGMEADSIVRISSFQMQLQEFRQKVSTWKSAGAGSGEGAKEERRRAWRGFKGLEGQIIDDAFLIGRESARGAKKYSRKEWQEVVRGQLRSANEELGKKISNAPFD